MWTQSVKESPERYLPPGLQSDIYPLGPGTCYKAGLFSNTRSLP